MKATTATPGGAAARASQKEATRARVLAAARELFDLKGYHQTTIREIAAHAGVAVGSVFTTFASKGEILSQVMQARLAPIYAELDRVAPHLRGPTAERLKTIFGMFFAFEAPQVRLFLAHIAAAYDWSLSPGARPYGRNARMFSVIRDMLAAGVEAGDVRLDVDLEEIVKLLTAAYAWTYRLVPLEGADTAALSAAMDRQIDVIAEGFRVR